MNRDLAGRFIMQSGMYKNYPQRCGPYLRVTSGPQRGQYVHIMIAEAKLGRKLLRDETVEHQNNNTLDNDPANLIVVTRPDHARLTAQKTRAAAAVSNDNGKAPF